MLLARSFYQYDANGNLTYDAHKEIQKIEYNYLNLPEKITFTNDRTITFLYDATGRKLRKTVTGNGQTEQRDYLDGIEYKDGKPNQFLHSEGTVRADEKGQFRYYFVLRDHLGNTRVTFSDLNNDDKVSEKEDIIQINNYYAFGLNMEGNWNGKDGANKYQYNEKEWNDDFGLGWNDYGTRMYDPAMARFVAIDLLADNYSFQTPYAYAANNPIRYRDFMGMNPQENCNCLTQNQLIERLENQLMAPLGQQWVANNQTHNMDQHGNNPAPPQPLQGSGTPAADPSKSSKGTPMVSGGSNTSAPFFILMFDAKSAMNVTKGDLKVAKDFINRTQTLAEKQLTKLINESGYDGSSDKAKILDFVNFLVLNGGNEEYAMEDTYGNIGVFTDIQLYLSENGSFQTITMSDPIIQGGVIPVPTAVKRAIMSDYSASMIVEESHSGKILFGGFGGSTQIEFHLKTNIGSLK
jgi:RHS repeat-associated protein